MLDAPHLRSFSDLHSSSMSPYLSEVSDLRSGTSPSDAVDAPYLSAVKDMLLVGGRLL